MTELLKAKLEETRSKLRAAVDSFVEVERMIMGKSNSTPVKEPPKQDFNTEKAAETVGFIQAWAENNPDFDTGFVDSVGEQIEEGKKISEKQLDALLRIVSKFRIEQ